MKLSPPLDGCVFEASFAIVERHSPIKGLVDLHFGAGEAEAAAIPLHDVVAADDAFVHEAADALECFWNRPTGSLPFALIRQNVVELRLRSISLSAVPCCADGFRHYLRESC